MNIHQRLPRLDGFSLCLALACGAVLTGCVGEAGDFEGDDDSAALDDSIIIGNNDLVPVAADGANVPTRYRGLLNGFGRMIVGNALCTATHVGGGVVVTAGHCFGAPASRVDHQPCSNTSVQWGYRAGQVASTSKCTEILAMRTGGGLDYAIIRVSPVPAVTIPVALGQASSSGTPLTIFSHPGGRPLEWSRLCQAMSPTSTEFSYQCDTQGGSSGATVLRDDTLQVTGIHWGGGGNANIATALTSTPLAEFIGSSVRLVAESSGKCMDVRSSSLADRGDIAQWSCNGTSAQAFRIEAYGDGTHRIVNRNSGKCVDVDGSGVADGTNVQQYACNNTNAQRFRIEDVGGGKARIVNVNSNKCVEVYGGGTGDGADIVQWSCNGGANQRWQIVAQ